MAAVTVERATQTIATTIEAFNADMEAHQSTLKVALDNEFDRIQAEASDSTKKVKTAFATADAQIRTDYAAMLLHVKAVETAYDGQDLRAHELDAKLQH